jgi:hypothetical protein
MYATSVASEGSEICTGQSRVENRSRINSYALRSLCVCGGVLGCRSDLRGDEYAFTQSMGTWLSWMTGISLLVVTVSSGVIAWIEFRSNPKEDAERGEWTNKMLFYGLVFAGTFFVAFLYWASLFFAG